MDVIAQYSTTTSYDRSYLQNFRPFHWQRKTNERGCQRAASRRVSIFAVRYKKNVQGWTLVDGECILLHIFSTCPELTATNIRRNSPSHQRVKYPERVESVVTDPSVGGCLGE